MGKIRVQDLRSSLGLKGPDCNGQWADIKRDANTILRRNGLLDKCRNPKNLRQIKLAAITELEAMHPGIFRSSCISRRAQKGVICDLFTLEIQRFSDEERKRQKTQKDREGWKEQIRQQAVGLPRQPKPPNSIENPKTVVIITAPSVPGFNSHLLRTDLIVDGNDSIDRLYKILQEDGLDDGRPNLKYTVNDEYGSTLSSNRHLQAAFQRIKNEGKLLTHWSVTLSPSTVAKTSTEKSVSRHTRKISAILISDDGSDLDSDVPIALVRHKKIKRLD